MNEVNEFGSRWQKVNQGDSHRQGAVGKRPSVHIKKRAMQERKWKIDRQQLWVERHFPEIKQEQMSRDHE